MGDQVGRITGKRIGEIDFRLTYGTPVDLGDLLVADDSESGAQFYLRVVDLSYGAEGGDQEWFERMAGNLMRLDESGEEAELFEKQRRLYKLARCSLLGCLRAGKFSKPKTIPEHFSKVRRPLAADFEFLRGLSGDLKFARLRSGETVLELEAGISSKAVVSHMGVFATTGMGKSNLMKRIAGAVLETGAVGLLIFDPHGEYFDGGGEEQLKGLVQHPCAERLRIYSSRSLNRKGVYSALTLSAAELTPEDVKHLYEFSEAQEEALSACYFRYGGEWLTALHDQEIANLGRAISSAGFAEQTLAVLKRRAESLLKRGFIHTDPTVSTSPEVVKALSAGQVVLIDSSNLTTRDELLIASALCRTIFHHYRRRFTADPAQFRHARPALIALEEAQRVLRKSALQSANIFARIAREGRKFRVGLCAVSQQPKLIEEELLSQFNTFCILGLADETDRHIVRSSAKQDLSELGTEIQMLAPGEALVTSPELPFALPVRIDLYEEYLKGLAAKSAGVATPSEIDPGFFA